MPHRAAFDMGADRTAAFALAGAGGLWVFAAETGVNAQPPGLSGEAWAREADPIDLVRAAIDKVPAPSWQ